MILLCFQKIAVRSLELANLEVENLSNHSRSIQSMTDDQSDDDTIKERDPSERRMTKLSVLDDFSEEIYSTSWR